MISYSTELPAVTRFTPLLDPFGALDEQQPVEVLPMRLEPGEDSPHGPHSACHKRIELNLLGQTFGIDLVRPALKLPAIGRVGMAL